MSGILRQAQDDRVLVLLEEGNALRREALALQKQALAEQRDINEQARRNIEQARGVNEQAIALQKRARLALSLVLPLIIVLIGYVSYLLFFKLR